TIPQIFLATAIMNGVVAVYIFSLVPEFLIRFLAWILIHTFYRVRIVNGQAIPDQGPAVLVCNHVSYVDAIAIMAASPRPVRFVMDYQIFKIPVMSWLFRNVRAIPIAPVKADPWLTEKAFVDIAQALHEGELVCIFPEGKLTRDGELNPFKGGVQKIIDRTPVPVLPLALRGLWGSLFSRDPSNPVTRTFKRGLFSRLELVAGEPIAADQVSPELLQEKVRELRGDWK
ncbi:1-acyl-sn-glycerol-3-phosphate acyltransferase, partial [uncultured Herbaspirillum sp.]